jgi:3-oxoacyl-[acyl-carrier protein] reductase
MLAREGAAVAVVASTSHQKAEAVSRAITSAGGNAKAFAADVRDGAATVRLVEEVQQAFGGIALLVNAAGVFFPTPAGETPAGDAARLIDINVTGTWNAINSVVPAMKQRGGGRIVNLSSTAGQIGIKGFSLYCASKAAISMMTRALAGELAPHGIAINAVAPGNTATPMNEGVRADPAVAEAMRNMTPSGVGFSDVADIASIVLFLLSDRAKAVHGATWLADEGISAAIG